jgi:hypothetical protein
VPFSIANNGLEAFQMVKEKSLGFFSLIFLDLAMPIWDGYRVCLLLLLFFSLSFFIFFFFFFFLAKFYFRRVRKSETWKMECTTTQ